MSAAAKSPPVEQKAKADSLEKSGVKPLSVLAEKSVVKSLGVLAECRFSCGSSLKHASSKVQLLLKKGDKWNALVLPGASDTDLKRAFADVGSCHGVIDLDPAYFTTTFQLSSTSILNEVALALTADVTSLRAELQKLNIHTPGSRGHFKAHVDTPRPNHMFGSLVVCLPTTFSGGALVTRHENHQVGFDWSSSPGSPKEDISWAAFFSDVEHEVLPVTDGYRVTLTYTLYEEDVGSATKQAAAKTSQLPAIVTNPFYKELCAALGNKDFFRKGGVLGFGSHHAYVFEEFNEPSNLPFLLKGADRVVYLAAKVLGLSVIVKPVVQEKDSWGDHSYVLATFQEFQVRGDAYESEPEYDTLCEVFRNNVHIDKYITWCQDLDEWQPAGVTVHYGNESRSVLTFYQTAGILVGIPKWSRFRKQLSTAGIKKATKPTSVPLAKPKSAKEPKRKKPKIEATRKQPFRSSVAKKKATSVVSKQAQPQASTNTEIKEQSSDVLRRLCFHGEMPSGGENSSDWSDWSGYY